MIIQSRFGCQFCYLKLSNLVEAASELLLHVLFGTRIVVVQLACVDKDCVQAGV